MTNMKQEWLLSSLTVDLTLNLVTACGGIQKISGHSIHSTRHCPIINREEPIA